MRLKNPRGRDARDPHRFQNWLFPHRTVAANVFANREVTRRWGWLDRRACAGHAAGAAELDVTSRGALVGPLALGEKQFVEIARTLEQESRIIILDEPNSALNEAESQRLFEIVRRLRERGITIVYVSHRLEEVFAIADRITVLRDGRYQGTHTTAETSIPQIITAMIGGSWQSVSAAADRRRPRPGRAGSAQIAASGPAWADQLHGSRGRNRRLRGAGGSWRGGIISRALRALSDDQRRDLGPW